MTTADALLSERFPRASRYHSEWLLAGVSGGANPLWLTEWLTEALDLKPGMRVLDLGCGRALSSIFLRREFDVQVWAVDLWFSAAENQERIRDAAAADGVFAMQADARLLPFSPEFFDAIVAIDSFSYFGTDDLYLNNIARFLKPSGVIGIAGAGWMEELEIVPPHLKKWWEPSMACLHSKDWWRRHWERTEIVDVAVADTLAGGWDLWRKWLAVIAPQNTLELETLDADQGRRLGYVRVVGRRRENARIEPPIVSMQPEYVRKPLLRGQR